MGKILSGLLSVFFHLLVATIIFASLLLLSTPIVSLLLIAVLVLLILGFKKGTKKTVSFIAVFALLTVEGIIAGLIFTPGGTPPAAKNAVIRSYFDQLKNFAVAWSFSQTTSTYIGFDENADGKMLADRIKSVSGDNYYNSISSQSSYCAKTRYFSSDKSSDIYWCIDAYGYLATTTGRYCTAERPYCTDPAGNPNPLICDETCYSNVANIKQDPSVCEKIKDNSIKDNCYYRIGIAKQDPSVCDNMENQTEETRCYRDIAIHQKDSSVCDGVQDQSMRDWCYQGVAEDTHDPSVCDKMQDSSRQDYCYLDIATNKDDPFFCGKIQSQSTKDNCFLLVSAAKRDKFICDRISDQSKKNECINNFK